MLFLATTRSTHTKSPNDEYRAGTEEIFAFNHDNAKGKVTKKKESKQVQEIIGTNEVNMMMKIRQ